MPRRFFRKFALNRENLRRKWFIEPFDHLLHDPDLFGIRRRSVVPAFSLGLFIAFMPIPGHPLIAALLAIALRVNVAVATVTTFISNPLTSGGIGASTINGDVVTAGAGSVTIIDNLTISATTGLAGQIDAGSGGIAIKSRVSVSAGGPVGEPMPGARPPSLKD